MKFCERLWNRNFLYFMEAKMNSMQIMKRIAIMIILSKIQIVSTGLLALWLERQTPHHKDMSSIPRICWKWGPDQYKMANQRNIKLFFRFSVSTTVVRHFSSFVL